MKKEAMLEGNISLILDSYNDIFSDFDPRPASERALSDDFLNECRKASRDKHIDHGLEVRLLVPKTKRDNALEQVIKGRLRNHFRKHDTQKAKETQRTKRHGMLWIVAGAMFSLIATSIQMHEHPLLRFAFVIFEPAGWFSFWTGFERLILIPTHKQAEIEFYRKMAHSTVTFGSY